MLMNKRKYLKVYNSLGRVNIQSNSEWGEMWKLFVIGGDVN